MASACASGRVQLEKIVRPVLGLRISRRVATVQRTPLLQSGHCCGCCAAGLLWRSSGSQRAAPGFGGTGRAFCGLLTSGPATARLDRRCPSCQQGFSRRSGDNLSARLSLFTLKVLGDPLQVVAQGCSMGLPISPNLLASRVRNCQQSRPRVTRILDSAGHAHNRCSSIS